MSSYGDDSGNDSVDNPLFTHKTWVGIAVPLAIVAGIVVAAAVCFNRRRRIRQRRNGLSLNRQGRLALERDILQEEGAAGQSGVDHGIYLGRYHPGRGGGSSGVVPGTRGRQQPRTANRWAWANTTDLAATTRTSHRIEGLNELGEAPPPYEPPPKPPKKHNSTSGSSDEAVHLDDNDNDDDEQEQQQQHYERGDASITQPARAHLYPRRESGSGSLPERHRSLDGDTIAATLTAATLSTTATTAATSSRSRPVSSASAEGAAVSTSSTVATPPPTSPPAYSDRTAGHGTGDDGR
ncbi:hypothetical protein SCUCBS95973_001747 [Sporothrix curviconia]|uniref:Uncharacterized protein n=1 Tax=Sporothrix curviconia TaxID=1260050 RepID=A0ABP0B155_9PEZI